MPSVAKMLRAARSLSAGGVARGAILLAAILLAAILLAYYLYQRAEAPPSSTSITEDGGIVSIQCRGPGTVLQVEHASYGPQNPSNGLVTCATYDVTQTVRELMAAVPESGFAVSASTFGLPLCAEPGQLVIKYTCTTKTQ